MRSYADSDDTHPSPAASGNAPASATHSLTVDESTANDPVSSVASLPSSLRTEPRYIRLPDALYNLRHRYPTVTESVFLECTRCHQWVAVPVLRNVPDEVRSDAIAVSAQGLEPIERRTSVHGPLRHTKQDALHRHEQLAVEATTTTQWRSQRLLEKNARKNEQNTSKTTTSATTHDGDSDRTASSHSPGMFEQILEGLKRGRRRNATADLVAQEGATAFRRHPLLYIPNPDTFICAGWQCAWDADALADLRQEWMDNIYKALPMPAVTEETLTSSSSVASSSSPSAASFPTSPSLSPNGVWQQQLQQHRTALNEALAEELHVSHHRRLSRACGVRLARLNGDHDGGGDHGSPSSLPPLSLPAEPLSASRQTTTSASASSTEGDMWQLSRQQQSWVKAAALHLLRNGADVVEGRSEGEKAELAEKPSRLHRPFLPLSPTSPSTTAAEEAAGPLLSAYCWAVCDACGKLRRVAQPFPGGAPFVCAMAVTASSSCRAAPHCAPNNRSRDSTNSNRNSGVLDAATTVENACSVSEVEGLIQCGVKLCEAELIAAALSSPFLPYPLKAQLTSSRASSGRHAARHAAVEGSEAAGTAATGAEGTRERLSCADVARVLLTEPLLRTIRSSVTEAVVKGTTAPPSPTRRRKSTARGRRTTTHVTSFINASRNGGEGDGAEEDEDDDDEAVAAAASIFLQHSLPILRELARFMKKRGTTSLVRQIQLTPAQIQAKREAVLRSTLLDSSQTSNTNASTDAADPASIDNAKRKETKQKRQRKEEEEKATHKAETALDDDGVVPTQYHTRVDMASRTASAKQDPSTATGIRSRERSSSAATASKAVSPLRAAEITTRAARGGRGRDRTSAMKPEEEPPALPVAVAAEAPPVQEVRRRGRPPKKRDNITPVATKSKTASASDPTHVAVAQAEQQKHKDHDKDSSSNDDGEDTPLLRPRRRRRAAARDNGDETADAPRRKTRSEAAAASPPQRRPGRPCGRPPKVKTELVEKTDGTVGKEKRAKVNSGDDDADAWEVVHWVQCDRCSKWRIVPQRVPPRIKFWECKMRYDAARGRATTCDDPDDADLSS